MLDTTKLYKSELQNWDKRNNCFVIYVSDECSRCFRIFIIVPVIIVIGLYFETETVNHSNLN